MNLLKSLSESFCSLFENNEPDEYEIMYSQFQEKGIQVERVEKQEPREQGEN